MKYTRKSKIWLVCIFVLALIAFTGVIRADKGKVTKPGDPGLVMHPEIKVVFLADGKTPATSETCGQCHDTAYIDAHNNHNTDKVKADCIVCHLRGSALGEDLSRVHFNIQLPDSRNCAQCHGLVHFSGDALVIPEGYECSVKDLPKGEPFGMTLHTGVIISAQDLSNSALNLSRKESLNFPWDVHARRHLKCIDCHFVANDPRYCGEDLPELGHLRRDPRKIKSPGEILKRPDHFLKASSCTCCHDPFAIHPGLPYKKRHMEVLSCTACHVPRIYGPALRSVDNTVLTAAGQGRVSYRGADQPNKHGASLNTAYLEGYRPFLFSHVYIDRNNLEDKKISPFNLVTRWYWKSGKTGTVVEPSLLHSVFFGDSEAGSYEKEILEVFDGNGDKVLEDGELMLDTQAKLDLVKSRLQANGIQQPEIAGVIDTYKISHGVLKARRMKLNCSDCHASESRFGTGILLSSFAPGGVVPQLEPNPEAIINGEVQINPEGHVLLKRGTSMQGYYVLGLHGAGWLDTFGLWLFILSIFAIMAHGLLRYLSFLKHETHQIKTKIVYMYRFYERLWHWTMASGIIILALTGLEIHYSGGFQLLGLELAVSIHNILAAILVINAFLSLFYHLTTGQIKHFFGFNNKFLKEAVVQSYFYIYGIFKNHPHPVNKTPERKLNPLQQLTYIFLLNILLPFQVITGILMWGAERWPALSNSLGGLIILAPLHNLGSWLFLTFIVVHVYLTTTGHTVFANIRAMITGYDDVAEDMKNEEYHRMMELKMVDLVGALIGRNKPVKELKE